MKIKKYFISVILVLGIGIWIFISKYQTNRELRGDTIGNWQHTEIAIQEDEWIYYVNYNNDKEIYKIHTDGTRRKSVAKKQTLPGIQVYDGWIYFYNLDDSCLSRIRTNGNQLQNLTETLEVSDMITNLQIADEHIYYLQRNVLYSMELDGKNVKKITDDLIKTYNVSEEWVHYTPTLASTLKEDRGIYRIKKNGTEKEKIMDGKIIQALSYEEWIYYISYEDNCALYKISMDGLECIIVSDEEFNDMLIYEEWLYYSKIEDGIYKMRLDGTERVQLYETETDVIEIYCMDEWIYFLEPKEKGVRLKLDDPFYRIKLDGTGKELVQ